MVQNTCEISKDASIRDAEESPTDFLECWQNLHFLAGELYFGKALCNKLYKIRTQQSRKATLVIRVLVLKIVQTSMSYFTVLSSLE